MELILTLLGSFLVAPFLLALTIVSEVGGLLLSLIFDVVTTWRARARRRRAPDGEPPSLPSRWPRIAMKVGSVLVALTLLLVTVVDLFWFGGFVRWSFDRIEASSGLRVEYASVEGSLWTGSITMAEMRIRRKKDEGLRCDVCIDHAALDISVTSLLDSSVSVDSLVVRKVTGGIQWPSKAKDKTGHERRAKRRFRIESLRVEDLDLELTNLPGKPYRLTTPRWRSEPLRSSWLPFDVLFRSNFEGTIAGAEFSVLSEGGPDGRHTRWRATNLPISYLAEKLGGKFRFLRAGALDLDVDDRWSLDDVAKIDSRWKIELRAMHAKNPLVRSIVTRLGSKTLEFRLSLDGNGLNFERNADDESFWSGLGSAIFGRMVELARKK